MKENPKKDTKSENYKNEEISEENENKEVNNNLDYYEEDDNDDDDDDVVDDDNDKEDLDNELDDDTVYFKFNNTKHKLEGKHSLKRDTIFQGKLTDEEDEDLYNSTTGDYFNKEFPIKKGTMFEMESRNLEDLENERNLKRDIYDILDKKTNLDFSSNRRKPNKQDFNSHYEMLIDNLDKKYTKSEIFVELSYYFTDHIFNMYKLLYPQHATNIIMELRDKGFLDELDDMNFI